VTRERLARGARTTTRGGDVCGGRTRLHPPHLERKERTVRYIDTGNGVTRDSIAFFREHRHRLNEIVEASVRFPGFDDPHNPYLMTLRDDRGDELLLSGCTAGYPGEGPRGAMQVLVESGWPADQAALVFTTPTLQLERDGDARTPVGATVRQGRKADSSTRSVAERRVCGLERS
jgi:hypothetical protein